MNIDNDAQNETSQIVELARLAEAAPITEIVIDGRRFLARRNDYMIEEHTLPNAAPVLMPKLAAQHVQIDTAASMIDYINRFKNPDTVLFADEKSRSITAIIDYHKASNGSDVAARLSKHRATLTLGWSDQWNVWNAQDEKLLRHVAFATFLEENQYDVSKPSGGELLEMCRDIQVKETMQFGATVRYGDTIKIVYQKEDDASSKQEMAIPVSFELSIPVFFGEPTVRVNCWMRRKIDDGALALGYKMAMKPLIIRNEFARIVGTVQAGVENLTTVYGRAG